MMVVPGLLATRVTLACTAHLVATVEGFRVWPEGVEFDVHLQTDTTVHTPAGTAAWADFDLRAGSDPGDLVELTVSHDGRQTSNASSTTWPGRAAGQTERVLAMRGGGGGVGPDGGDWRMTWWLTPLPTTGPVEFRIRWVNGGLSSPAVRLDARVLADAADRAERCGRP